MDKYYNSDVNTVCQRCVEGVMGLGEGRGGGGGNSTQLFAPELNVTYSYFAHCHRIKFVGIQLKGFRAFGLKQTNNGLYGIFLTSISFRTENKFKFESFIGKTQQIVPLRSIVYLTSAYLSTLKKTIFLKKLIDY